MKYTTAMLLAAFAVTNVFAHGSISAPKPGFVGRAVSNPEVHSTADFEAQADTADLDARARAGPFGRGFHQVNGDGAGPSKRNDGAGPYERGVHRPVNGDGAGPSKRNDGAGPYKRGSHGPVNSDSGGPSGSGRSYRRAVSDDGADGIDATEEEAYVVAPEDAQNSENGPDTAEDFSATTATNVPVKNKKTCSGNAGSAARVCVGKRQSRAGVYVGGGGFVRPGAAHKRAGGALRKEGNALHSSH